MSLNHIGCLLMLSAVLPGFVRAQAPKAKPDSAEVKALIDKAKKAGRAMWADEAHFFCEAPHPTSPNDPEIPPTKIFDNVYGLATQGLQCM